LGTDTLVRDTLLGQRCWIGVLERLGTRALVDLRECDLLAPTLHRLSRATDADAAECQAFWRSWRPSASRISLLVSSPSGLAAQLQRQAAIRVEWCILRQRIGHVVFAVLLAALCAADAWQLVQAARGAHPDPPSLLVTHGATALLAGAAAVGSWRRRRWAVLAVLGWGAVTAAMLVALGPLLDTPTAERPQLWVAAVVIACLASLTAWYLHQSAHAPAP
jgi:hypothetical protein